MADFAEIVNTTKLEVLESQHLLKLIKDLSGDTRDAIEIINCWLVEIPELAEKMCLAFSESDQQTLKICAHTIKSAARSVGAMELGEMTEQLQRRDIENGVTQFDISLVKNQVDMAIKDLNTLCEALKAG